MFAFRVSSNSLVHCRILFGAFIVQSEKPPSEVLHSLLSNKYNEVKMIIINKKSLKVQLVSLTPNTPRSFYSIHWPAPTSHRRWPCPLAIAALSPLSSTESAGVAVLCRHLSHCLCNVSVRLLNCCCCCSCV